MSQADEQPLREPEASEPRPAGETGASNSPPIVGIGASAGGLEAIETFFDHVPPDTGAAFVIVQHVLRDFKSLMVQLLARHTTLAIHRVERDVDIEPNAIYLIPPRRNMTIRDGRLALSEPIGGRTLNYPIDVFLRSLAADRRDAAVAVVLSGTGTDGTRGIEAIKQEGGVVLVQDPETAEFDGMPRSAIATGVADLVLPPWKLAKKVVAFLEHTPLERLVDEQDRDVDGDVIVRIVDQLARESGVDFRRYKRCTIQRRIERRMRLHRLDGPDHYLELLRGSRTERDLLRRDVLINVTTFFCDPGAFEVLLDEALPRIAERADPEGLIRVWSVGCSTGEEPYSIAMCIEEFLEARGLRLRYKVFATDLNREAIAKASEGVYPQSIETDLGPDRLDRFFERRGDAYQISRAIREKVLFAVHDLISDPPFTRMHLVSCRNLLIHLPPELQNKALGHIHFATAKRGILFLGTSETPGDFRKDFSQISPKWRIYEKRRDQRLRTPATSVEKALQTDERPAPRRAPRAAARHLSEESAYMRICEAVASAHTQAMLVVDDRLELLHVFGDAAPYLETPKGRVSYVIGSSLKDWLQVPVSTAIRRSEKTNIDVSFVVPSPGGVSSVGVRVLPVRDEQSGMSYSIVLLGEPTRVAERAKGSADFSTQAVERIRELEAELESTEKSLRVTIEEVETVNEELQATNEELLVSNEELQTTNEELHSVNEELYTVNAEHQSKIQELTELNDAVENLLRSTDIGTVFLDDEFRIQKFTPASTQAIALIASDVGRPFSDLSHKLEDATLMDDVAHVLRTAEPMEKDVENDLGTHLLMRIHPYRTERGKVCGVVLTFVDITDIKRTQVTLKESERRLRSIAENSRDVYWIVNAESLEIQYVSRAYETLWGQSIENLYLDRMQWMNAIHPEDRQRVLKQYRETIASGSYEAEYRVVRPDGTVRWVRDRAFPAAESGSSRRSGVAEDITGRVEAEHALRDTRAMFDTVFERAHVGSALLTRDGHVRRANSLLRDMLGLDEGSLVDRDIVDFAAKSSQASLTRAIRDGFLDDGNDLEIAFVSRNGTEVFTHVTASVVEGGAADKTHYVCQVRDVTKRHRREEEVRALTSTLETAANNDPLTNLLNRRGLDKVLAGELRASRRSGETMAAILMDCDDFKSINDNLGHSVGDVVLKEVASRIVRTLRPSDWTARIGGDEFLALLPGTRTAEALHVAEKLRRAIASAPVEVMDRRVPMTVSIGVATLPLDTTTIEEILASTEAALVRSKTDGKNLVSGDDVAASAAAGSGSIAHALLNLSRGRGLYSLAQPIWNLKEARVVGYEMLSRGPDGPLGKPRDFFRLSREKQILTPIDLRCLEANLRAARHLASPDRVHVNLFPSTIAHTPAERILEIIEAHGPEARLCVELSEQQFVGDPHVFTQAIGELRKADLDVAIDDVGFGRSSLETLIVLEPHFLKVDQSMIHGIHEDEGRRRSLARLLHVARSLEAKVIAEGVQQPEDKEVLIDLDVEMGQGYLWGHPYAPV